MLFLAKGERDGDEITRIRNRQLGAQLHVGDGDHARRDVRKRERVPGRDPGRRRLDLGAVVTRPEELGEGVEERQEDTMTDEQVEAANGDDMAGVEPHDARGYPAELRRVACAARMSAKRELLMPPSSNRTVISAPICALMSFFSAAK